MYIYVISKIFFAFFDKCLEDDGLKRQLLAPWDRLICVDIYRTHMHKCQHIFVIADYLVPVVE